MGTAASAASATDDRNVRAIAEVTEGYIRSDSISHWTANRVGVWLMNTCELGQYCEMFYTARVNGAVLKDLTDEDLEDLGIYNRMHRKRIFTEICKQNDFELDELERSVGTPSPRQYWSTLASPKNSLYSNSPRSQPRASHDFKFKSPRNSGNAPPRDSPKFTLGPGGTPRAWNPNSQPGDVQASSPKASPFKTVASVNLFEALDSVEAQQKRRQAKWYANKVVEKSLIAMRAALKTARGMAVLQAEARYHGSLEAARETLMHNTRLQARQKAIEDFYSGNWRHKAVSPMAKYAKRGMSVDEQMEAAMRDEAEERKRLLAEAQTQNKIGSASLYADDEDGLLSIENEPGTNGKSGLEDSSEDEDGGSPKSDNQQEDEEANTRPSPRILRSVSSIRRKYDAPEGKRNEGPGRGTRFNKSPGEILVDSLLEDDEDEDEEERALFEAAATKGLHLRQLIATKKRMLHEARDRNETSKVIALQRELVRRLVIVVCTGRIWSVITC